MLSTTAASLEAHPWRGALFVGIGCPRFVMSGSSNRKLDGLSSYPTGHISASSVDNVGFLPAGIPIDRYN